MPVYKRNHLAKLYKGVTKGDIAQFYLVFGERYLCREAMGELVNRLLPDPKTHQNQIHNIDGDQEDFSKTLNLLRTYSLFPGRRLFRVIDSKLFFSKGVAKTLWDKAAKAVAAKEPDKAGRYLGQMVESAGPGAAKLDHREIGSLAAARWKNLLGFAKPKGDLAWIKELPERKAANADHVPVAGGDPAELFIDAFTAGIPTDNILILAAEAVDKRKRLYKFVEQHGVVVDLAVDSGGSSAARKDQEAVIKELVRKTLAGFDKKLAPQAEGILLERVGFHPVAAVLETEKLALSVGEATSITPADVDAVIGRTREEALYELTDAFTRQQLDRALLIAARLQENGIHALAILATLRNHIRKLLLLRSFQEAAEPRYSKGMSFPAFQRDYLAKLKTVRNDWDSLWQGHPYALYMQFLQAEKFSCPLLQSALRRLLEAEYRLKGSAVPAPLVLENLLLALIRPRAQARR